MKVISKGAVTISSVNGSFSIYKSNQSGSRYYFKEKHGVEYIFKLKGNEFYMTSPYKITFYRTDKKQSNDFADIFNYLQEEVTSSSSTPSTNSSTSTT